MSFRTEDFKRVTRKSKGAVPASVYPHRIDAKKEAAKLERLILHFDAAHGRRRGDMDGAALMDFVGDPRLARGLVATLGQWYRWRTPTIPDLVGRLRAQRLLSAGIRTAADARAHTYARVNASHNGFTTEETRASVFADLGEPFGLNAAEWDDLLTLDSEASQILTRAGGVPAASEIAACYNFHSADTVLQRATAASVCGLCLSASAATDLRAFAKMLGTAASVGKDGSMVTLSGGRLGRVLLFLLHQCATRTTAGFVDTAIAGRVFRMTVATDILRALGCPLTGATGEHAPLRRRMEAAEDLHAGLLKARAQGEAVGWAFAACRPPARGAGKSFWRIFGWCAASSRCG